MKWKKISVFVCQTFLIGSRWGWKTWITVWLGINLNERKPWWALGSAFFFFFLPKSIVQWRYLHIQYITAHSFTFSSLCDASDAVLALSSVERGGPFLSPCASVTIVMLLTGRSLWSVGDSEGKEGAFVTVTQWVLLKIGVSVFFFLESIVYKVLNCVFIAMSHTLTGEPLALFVCYSTARFVKWFTCLEGSCCEVWVVLWRHMVDFFFFFYVAGRRGVLFFLVEGKKNQEDGFARSPLLPAIMCKVFLHNTKMCLQAHFPTGLQEEIQLLRGQ